MPYIVVGAATWSLAAFGEQFLFLVVCFFVVCFFVTKKKNRM